MQLTAIHFAGIKGAIERGRAAAQVNRLDLARQARRCQKGCTPYQGWQQPPIIPSNLTPTPPVLLLSMANVFTGRLFK